MKRKKQIVSFILSLLMIVTMTPLSTVTSDAADSTSEVDGNGLAASFPSANVKSLRSDEKYGGVLQSSTVTRHTVSNATAKASASTEDAPALQLGVPEYAVAGTYIHIPVVLEKTALGTLQFCLTYDETRLKYVSCSYMAFSMYDINASTDGMIRAACIDNFAVPAGEIMMLDFSVNSSAVGNANFILTVEEAYDERDSALLLGPYAWDTRIFQTLPGDVNGDLKVTAMDARWVLQASSGERTFNEAQMRAADVNGDGKVNAVDAQWILQIASGTRSLKDL